MQKTSSIKMCEVFQIGGTCKVRCKKVYKQLARSQQIREALVKCQAVVSDQGDSLQRFNALSSERPDDLESTSLQDATSFD